MLSARNFAIHDEAQLERAATSGMQGAAAATLSPSPACGVEFTRCPGRSRMRDGVVRGPMLGGTIDGEIDYASDEVLCAARSCRSTASTICSGRFRWSGCSSAATKEGLLGITYEVVGHAGQSVLHVNPISALAPGLLRKLFEFPASGATSTSVRSTAARAKHRLDRLQQHVLLAAERKLDDAFGREVLRPISRIFSSVTARVVDLEPAALDLARAPSPFEATRPALTKALSTPRPASSSARGDFDRRQAFGERAFLESLARGVGGLLGGVAAVQQRGRFGGEHLLRLVDLAALAAPRAARSRRAAAR